MSEVLKDNVDFFRNSYKESDTLIVRYIFIGKGQAIDAALIFIKGLADQNAINRDILDPLMIHIEEGILVNEYTAEYLCRRYVAAGNAHVEIDIEKGMDTLKIGNSLLFIDGVEEFIVIDTADGEMRQISEPINEMAIKGPRNGFIENLDVNISLIRRSIKDTNLSIEKMTAGSRTQTSIAMMYLTDVADKDIVNDLRTKISAINTDQISGAGMLEQLIERYAYTVFPQMYSTERPDRAVSKILEGRIAVIIQGTPFVIIVPSLFVDFFHTAEDYNERTIITFFVRLLRTIAIFIVITIPAAYLVLIRYNSELIPIKFLLPIVISRRGIALTPVMEILSIEILVEFLREGGLRLPQKIGQTLSVVGGFIIGDAAVRSRLVSPVTLVVTGVAVIATFVIPNYEMSLAIRLLRFPMLFLTQTLGIFGIAVGWYILLVHLYSLESFGVPYYYTNKAGDLKDMIYRAPLWKMNKRPLSVPIQDTVRQKDFKNRL